MSYPPPRAARRFDTRSIGLAYNDHVLGDQGNSPRPGRRAAS